jgi:hypothetical protein
MPPLLVPDRAPFLILRFLDHRTGLCPAPECPVNQNAWQKGADRRRDPMPAAPAAPVQYAAMLMILVL